MNSDVWIDQDPGDENDAGWAAREIRQTELDLLMFGRQAAIDSMGRTPNRHPNSEKFHSFLREAGELHDRKQRDYGKGDDPFANVRSSSDWGMPGWVGAMVRLNDKVKRLQSLARTGNLSNEGAVDSFMDIAVYALIARVLFEEEA